MTATQTQGTALFENQSIRAILGIDELCSEIRSLKEANLAQQTESLPYWINLKKACELKGVSYNSAKSKPSLQPRHGTADATLNGRRVWRRDTVISWLDEVDDQTFDGIPVSNSSTSRN